MGHNGVRGSGLAPNEACLSQRGPDLSTRSGSEAVAPVLAQVFAEPLDEGGGTQRRERKKAALLGTAFRGEYRSRTGDLLHAMQAL